MGKRNFIADFRELLEKMFRLDGADGLQLDFGIYRVIRLRENRIKSELIDKLEGMADEVLSHFAGKDADSRLRELEKAKERFLEATTSDALDAKGDITSPALKGTTVGKNYENAKEAARLAVQVPKITGDIFNNLLQFFGRYYEGGDFMPLRRMTKKGAYSLPYNGEDVVLHWANRGQYYVKTADRFLSYSFPLAGGGNVKFVVRDTDDLPTNNNKSGAKFFFPQIKDAVLRGHTLEIPMEFRAIMDSDGLDTDKNKLQQQINEKATATAEKMLPKKITDAAAKELFGDKDDEGQDDEVQNAFARYLGKYCRGNDSDFFIHKDLAGFLSNELDAYIKTEIVNLEALAEGDDGDIKKQAVLARAVRMLGGKIIVRLGELENFQKKLWEKKKFVFGTHYIVRLGAIDEKPRKKLLPQIVACDKQWKEWETLGIFAGKKSERERFLRDNPSLPLNTANFDEKFCDELIASFNDLEESIDGVCFHSENWQALNLMAGKYAEQVNCVYIDPPYNTSEESFLYKNLYKHSSWASMMEDRLSMAESFITKDGVISIAIDDEEVFHLKMISDSVFGMENFMATLVYEGNPAGRSINTFFATCHDYVLVYAKNLLNASIENVDLTPEQKASYNLEDEKSKYQLQPLRRSGGLSTPDERPNSCYPIYYCPDSGEINISPLNQSVEIWPIDSRGKMRVWRITPPSLMKAVNNGDIIIKKSRENYSVQIKSRIKDGIKPKTIFKDPRYSNAVHGTVLLSHILGEKNFSYPKSLHTVKDTIKFFDDDQAIILDYFAGSGTTAHAIIALNREDGGKRKFILAEMGDYFDTVLLPRIKKIIYAPYWKDGKPTGNGNGNGFLPDEAADRAPRLVKYHYLESYEDTLENIEFEGENKLAMDGGRYMWEWESKDNIAFAPPQKLFTPFDFKLKRAGKNKNMATADLPETFNLMSGMRLRTRRVLSHKGGRYQFDIGTLDGKATICVWRNIGENWEKSDCEADSEFVQKECVKIGKEFKEFAAANILTNGTCAATVDSIDPIFNKLMLGREG